MITSRHAMLAVVYQLSARQFANLCKTYMVPLLDWGHTVSCAQGLRHSSWKCIDQVIEDAVAGPVFGALTRDNKRRIPLSVSCNAIGEKDTRQRRGNLARGLHRHLIDLPADDPTQRCIQAEASADPTLATAS